MASVKMPGLKKFARRLKSIEKSVSNTRRLHGESVVLYEQWVKRNFIKEGKLHDSSAKHWKKLSPITLHKRKTRKRAPKTTDDILRDFGWLYLKWSRTFNDKQARFKSNQGYSSVHEHGGKSYLEDEKIWIIVPQRKIFPEKKQGKKIIRPAIDRYMKRAFK